MHACCVYNTQYILAVFIIVIIIIGTMYTKIHGSDVHAYNYCNNINGYILLYVCILSETDLSMYVGHAHMTLIPNYMLRLCTHIIHTSCRLSSFWDKGSQFLNCFRIELFEGLSEIITCMIQGSLLL